MPLFDFKCETCNTVVELLVRRADVLSMHCVTEPSHGPMTRLQSAPASVRVEGYSAVNGYSSARTITTSKDGITTHVKGNFEAFADGLHK